MLVYYLFIAQNKHTSTHAQTNKSVHKMLWTFFFFEGFDIVSISWTFHDIQSPSMCISYTAHCIKKKHCIKCPDKAKT